MEKIVQLSQEDQCFYIHITPIQVHFPYACVQGDMCTKVPLCHWKKTLDWCRDEGFIIPGFASSMFKFIENDCKTEMKADWSHPNVVKLMPFQRKGIEFMVEKDGGLIADEMGTGKTVQSIVYTQVTNKRRILVLCPKVVVGSWSEQIKLWDDEKAQVLKTGKDFEKIEDVKWTITKYDLLRSNAKKMRLPLDVIICDECHYIQNPSSDRSKGFRQLWMSTGGPRIIFLSGTPMRCAYDMYTFFSYFFPFFNNKSEFLKRYCLKTFVPFGPKNNFNYKKDRKALQHELQALLSFSTKRRLKSNVLKNLPKKEFIIHHLPQLKKEDEISPDLLTIKVKNLLKNDKFSQAHCACCKPRCEIVIDYLKEWKKSFDSPTILFFHHKIMLERLRDLFPDAPFIDGSTAQQKRKELVERFQANLIPIVLLSISAAGIGITLTISNKVIFCEQHLDHKAMLQAEDRVHRIGQKNDVEIHHLLVPGSTDDLIFHCNRRKVSRTSELMKDGAKRISFSVRKK